MARRLVYYMRERVRHHRLHRAAIDFRLARRVTRLLAHEFNVALWGVEKTSGRRNSHFRPQHHVIRYNVDYLNWLLVLHEFAHALDWKRRRVAYRTARMTGQRLGAFRWHGREHAAIVDDLVALVERRNWVAVPPPPAPWMLNRRARRGAFVPPNPTPARLGEQSLAASSHP